MSCRATPRALADGIAAARPERMVMVCFATGFAALAPMLIPMSQQVRPSTPIILVYAVATLALLRLANEAAARRPLPRGWIAAFFVCQALLLGVARRDRARRLGVVRQRQIVAGLIYRPAFAMMRLEASG